MPKSLSPLPQTVDDLLTSSKAAYYRFLRGGSVALRRNGWWIVYHWTSNGPAGYAKTGAVRHLPRN